MESIVSTFHIDWKIIIAQAVNFSIVFAVLYYYALKPLSKLMKEREDKISKGISDAKTNAEVLDKSVKEYENTLAKARAEANVLFQKGTKEAEKKKTEMLESAKSEAEAVIINAKKILEAEKIKIIEEAKKEIVSLAMIATEKILKPIERCAV